MAAVNILALGVLLLFGLAETALGKYIYKYSHFSLLIVLYCFVEKIGLEFVQV